LKQVDWQWQWDDYPLRDTKEKALEDRRSQEQQKLMTMYAERDRLVAGIKQLEAQVRNEQIK